MPNPNSEYGLYETVLSVQDAIWRTYGPGGVARDVAKRVAAADPSFRNPERFVESIANDASLSDPYFVSSEIATLIMQAAGTLPSCQLAADLLPTRDGFMYFETAYRLPLTYAHTEDGCWPLRALAWTPVGEPAKGNRGVLVSGWIDTNPPHYIPLFAHSEHWVFGDLWDMPRDTGRALIDPDLAITELESEGTLVNYRRVFMTALTFLAQELATVSKAPVPRAQRKLMERSRREVPNSVRVVHLRRFARPERDPDEQPHERHIEWKHRWQVRSHWRNQFYPSLSRHHPKFIDSYWKNKDSDLPPNLSKVVYAVVR